MILLLSKIQRRSLSEPSIRIVQDISIVLALGRSITLVQKIRSYVVTECHLTIGNLQAMNLSIASTRDPPTQSPGIGRPNPFFATNFEGLRISRVANLVIVVPCTAVVVALVGIYIIVRAGSTGIGLASNEGLMLRLRPTHKGEKSARDNSGNTLTVTW